VERRLIADGRLYRVECAVCADGSSPASDFLDQLAQGMWAPDPQAAELPSDAQLKDSDVLLEFCQQLAEDGVPPYRTAVNDLDDGIWEFKRGAKRLSFYDTPGDGTFTPKYRIIDLKDSDHVDEDTWWFPDFDEFIRLGHAFAKSGNYTTAHDIAETKRIRREDLEHDR
jgi:hypothetical protein